MRYLIALAAVNLLFLANPVRATTIRVPDDQPSIRAGIDATSPGDTVLVACGTYYEHDIEMKSGVYLTSEMGQADCVTVDAQQQGRVFLCAYVDNLASLVGFTITGGFADSGGGMYCGVSSPMLANCAFVGNQTSDNGGGIYCYNSSPTLTGCAFVENQASQEGGGMYCYYSSSPTLTNCTFVGNEASGGGGMQCDRFSSPVLTDCTFAQNEGGYGGGGGGMSCTWSSSPKLTDCAFVGNVANGGAGMSCHDASSPVLTDCTFSGNQAGWDGGGMRHSSSSAMLILTRCSFSENQAGGYGGGIHWHNSYSYALTACTFKGNQAEYGGGTYSAYQAPPVADCSLIGCTFGENQAVKGGGMYYQTSSTPALTNCTFAGNQAEYGGGMYCSGTSPTLTNSVISFSQMGEGIHCSYSTSSPELSCCDVYGNAGGNWVGCIEDQYGVNGNFAEDPLFCDMNDGDFTLCANSPCLPDGNDCGVLIGALSEGCDDCVSPAEVTTWGSIKAMYR